MGRGRVGDPQGLRLPASAQARTSTGGACAWKGLEAFWGFEGALDLSV